VDTETYFNTIPEDRKEAIYKLRSMVQMVFPGYSEDMSYKVPTYTHNKLKICALASQKQYMTLYVMNYDLLTNFKGELSYLNCGKSCIRFKKLDDKTATLLKKVLVFIRENVIKSVFYKS
jgi:uncharacterized protein YdhG (YjbR/CyaY superfamily)